MEITGLGNSTVIEATAKAIERGIVERFPIGQSFGYEINVTETYEEISQEPMRNSNGFDEKPIRKSNTQKKGIKETKDTSANAEKTSPLSNVDSHIDFPESTTREKHTEPLKEIASAIGEFERTGGKPEISDATLTERQFVKEYAPILAEICGWAQTIGDAKSAAKKLYRLRFDKVRMDERLSAYRNGEGAQFRKPNGSAHYVVSQIEKDLVKKIQPDDSARVRAALEAM
jgi:hypothetical protein